MTSKINWYYHRNGCKTCGKSLDFIETHKIEVQMTRDARKETIPSSQIDEVISKVNKIYSCKGKKIDYLKLDDKTPKSQIESLVVGPTGNLRAPSIIKNKTLLVGFDEDTFKKLLLK